MPLIIWIVISLARALILVLVCCDWLPKAYRGVVDRGGSDSNCHFLLLSPSPIVPYGVTPTYTTSVICILFFWCQGHVHCLRKGYDMVQIDSYWSVSPCVPPMLCPNLLPVLSSPLVELCWCLINVWAMSVRSFSSIALTFVVHPLVGGFSTLAGLALHQCTWIY